MKKVLLIFVFFGCTNCAYKTKPILTDWTINNFALSSNIMVVPNNQLISPSMVSEIYHTTVKIFCKERGHDLNDAEKLIQNNLFMIGFQGTLITNDYGCPSTWGCRGLIRIKDISDNKETKYFSNIIISINKKDMNLKLYNSSLIHEFLHAIGWILEGNSFSGHPHNIFNHVGSIEIQVRFELMDKYE